MQYSASYLTAAPSTPLTYGLTTNVITVPILGHDNSVKVEYPLYDRLISEITANPTAVNVTNMANIINKISDAQSDDFLTHYNELLKLCINYAVLHHQYQPNPRKLPYFMRTMNGGRGVLVVVSELPGPLVQIIDAYINGKY